MRDIGKLILEGRFFVLRTLSKVSNSRKKVLITPGLYFLIIVSRIYHVIFHVILTSVNT